MSANSVNAVITALRGGKFYAPVRDKLRRILKPVKERNRDKDARAIAHMGLVQDIKRRIADRQSNEEIAAALKVPTELVQNLRFPKESDQQ